MKDPKQFFIGPALAEAEGMRRTHAGPRYSVARIMRKRIAYAGTREGCCQRRQTPGSSRRQPSTGGNGLVATEWTAAELCEMVGPCHARN